MGLVRIVEIEINNFKNVDMGKVVINSLSHFKKNEEPNNILGVYGQNASGKTTFIESFYVLKLLLSGEQIKKHLLDLLKDNKKTFFKYVFLIEEEKVKYKVSYSVELEKDKENNKVIISKEKIKYSVFDFENKTNTRTIVDYDISYDSNNVIKPTAIYNMFCKEEENKIKLLIAKALSRENSVSFIFNQNSIDNFKDVFGSEKIHYKILSLLNYFGSHNLLVLCSDFSENVNDGLTLGLIYRLFTKSGGDIDIKVNTNIPNIVSKDAYDIIDGLIKNINIVLQAIIPDFKLGIKKKGKACIQEYEMEVEFEFTSIRGEDEFPLKCEAEGTRKIVSSLGLMIAVYNDPNVCLLIDELDSGMFEFLFGEILTIFKENSKGQFIFTANNLRALEVLDKSSIVFTTINPKNKYIRFKGVKTTNNLRSLYLRSINEGGQEERLYKLTDREKIDRKFKASWNKEYSNIIKNNYE